MHVVHYKATSGEVCAIGCVTGGPDVLWRRRRGSAETELDLKLMPAVLAQSDVRWLPLSPRLHVVVQILCHQPAFESV